MSHQHQQQANQNGYEDERFPNACMNACMKELIHPGYSAKTHLKIYGQEMGKKRK